MLVDDWLSSFDDGQGDVQGVDELSDDDSSDWDDNEPERGIVSTLFDSVKLVNDENGLWIGSLYLKCEKNNLFLENMFCVWWFTGRNLGCSFLGFSAFVLNDSNNSASCTLAECV